jgi:adenylosuccinate lyase
VNPFLDLVAEDAEVPLARADLEGLMDPVRFVGRAPQQVSEFLAAHVRPVLAQAGALPEARDLDV